MKKRWENHCDQCGLCCYEKIKQEDGSWVIDLSKPCPWLDKEGGLCTVYEKRLKVNPRCRRITLFKALFAAYLPPSCGYVRKFRLAFLPPPKVVLQDSAEEDADSQAK